MENPSLKEPLPLPSHMLPSDALFWYAEQATPGLRPLVAGLLLLDRAPQRHRFLEAMNHWSLLIPRLRQRVREDPLGLTLPQWVEDPNFDLSYHLREVELPSPGSREQLFEFISAIFAAPLDRQRPLWEAHVIHGVAGNRAAIFVKVHHCVMDGVGSMAGFEAMTQRRPNEPLPSIPLRRRSRSLPLPGAVLRTIRTQTERLASLGFDAARVATRAIRDPGSVLEQARATVRGLRAMIDDLTAQPVTDPIGERATGIGRRLDGMTLDLEKLRAAKEQLGVTLNDLMLAIFAGALGDYYRSRKVFLDELHCMVPISLRLETERLQLGNRIGMCNVRLPIGERDPERRLQRIREQTLAAKRDRRGAAYPFLMQLLAVTPGFLFRRLAQSAIGQINVIVTNVPGPTEVRYIAGVRVREIYPYAPVAEKLPLAIALLSYGQQYGIGIDTDPAAIPDPQRLRSFISSATRDMLAFAKRRGTLDPVISRPHSSERQTPSRATRPERRHT